jgi:pimeloyl-ACP methyl ester carboxylesterase
MMMMMLRSPLLRSHSGSCCCLRRLRAATTTCAHNSNSYSSSCRPRQQQQRQENPPRMLLRQQQQQQQQGQQLLRRRTTNSTRLQLPATTTAAAARRCGSRSRSSSSLATAPLHTEWIAAAASVPTTSSPTSSGSGEGEEESPGDYVFLHGLLGQQKNLRSLANGVVALRRRRSGGGGLMVDLTGHGKSPRGTAKTTLQDVARDLQVVLQQRQVGNGGDNSNSNSYVLVGHSLGGRIALRYASDATILPRPRCVWLLDTVPAIADASVLHVMKVASAVLQQGQNKQPWGSIRALTVALVEQHHLPMATAQWLAMQYSVRNQRFAFDAVTAAALIGDMKSNSNNFYDQVRATIQQGIPVRLVRGGANPAWNDTDANDDSSSNDSKIATTEERLRDLTAESANLFTQHVLPEAGHWVHVDDLPGLLQLFRDNVP